MLNEGNGISVKFLIVIATLAVFGFAIDEAYAAPSITSYVANDPDDGDTVYSDGDTITINLSSAGNVTIGIITDTTDITGNFTFVPNPLTAATFTGEWVTTSQLLITLTSIGTNTLVVGTSTVDPSAGNNIGDPNPNDNSLMSSADPDVLLTGDFGLFVAASGGSGCDGECNAPTLGVNSVGSRLVDNGFSYNGKAVDVESFYTSYPLVTAFINRDNTATFKIYEDQGPQNIRHVALAFGLGNGQMFTNSKAVIEWDRSWDGKETVTEIDPENALKDVSVETSTGPCRSDSIFSECLIVTMHHSFSKALDFNIISTNVWDSNRNSWQNYYNHGVEVEDPDAYPYVKTSYEKPIMVEPLCIGEDATNRITCAFEKVKDWSTQNAEDTLNDILNGNYVWK